MITVEDAFQRVLSGVTPLPTEKCSLHDAMLRVVASPVSARRDQPGLNISAMDGYAIRSQDMGVENDTVLFSQIGEIAAGEPALDLQIGANSCVRIFTGAAVPDGFDQVIPQEQASASGQHISLQGKASAGDHIRPAGGDFRDRQILLDASEVLAPKNIGLLAAAGHSHVMVHRAARVTLIPTGNELLQASDGPGVAHQTIDSATPMISALLRHAGAMVSISAPIADAAEAIEEAIKSAADADLVITIGGASVGDHDHMHRVLKSMGADLNFWKIAMRPGKPLMSATIGRQRLLGLPGNPVSAFVTALLFARPLVDALMGRPAPFPSAAELPVTADLKAGGPRAHFMRARLVETDTGLMVDPAQDQDSAKMSVLAACDGLLVRPINCQPAQKGDRLPFIPF